MANAQRSEMLYLICGPYNDVNQHFNFNLRPFLSGGLRGVYEKALGELQNAKNREEEEFLNAVCHGVTSLRRVAEKFAERAEEMLLCESDPECAENLKTVASTACRVPWEAPKTFYEALATVAFMRTAMGSLEGVGPNTFGRLDKDLISFYRADVECGEITADKAYELICKFLMIWDCHYDHDMIMAGYSDHELENTYTLGGCDDDGGETWSDRVPVFTRCGRIYDAVCYKGATYVVQFCNDATESFLGDKKEHVYRLYKSENNGESFDEVSVIPTDSMGRSYASILFDKNEQLHLYIYNVNDEHFPDHLVSSDLGKSWVSAGVSFG